MPAAALHARPAAGIVEWCVTPSRYVTTIGDKPTASELARYQAEQGALVTNLRGESLTLDEIHRQLVRLLNGQRNREELTEAMVAFLREGNHTLRRDGDNTPVTDEGEVRDLLGPALEKALRNLAKSCLLVG